MPTNYASAAPPKAELNWTKEGPRATVTIEALRNTPGAVSIQSLESRSRKVTPSVAATQRDVAPSVLGYYRTSFQILLTPAEGVQGVVEDTIIVKLGPPFTKPVEVPVFGSDLTAWSLSPGMAMFVFSENGPHPPSYKVTLTSRVKSFRINEIRNPLTDWLEVLAEPASERSGRAIITVKPKPQAKSTPPAIATGQIRFVVGVENGGVEAVPVSLTVKRLER